MENNFNTVFSNLNLIFNRIETVYKYQFKSFYKPVNKEESVDYYNLKYLKSLETLISSYIDYVYNIAFNDKCSKSNINKYYSEVESKHLKVLKEIKNDLEINVVPYILGKCKYKKLKICMEIVRTIDNFLSDIRFDN